MINPYKFFVTAAVLFSAFFLFLTLSYTRLAWWIALLSAWNVSAFVLVGYDKKVAGTGAVRIPERIFYAISALAGSLGVLLGMAFFRHKTKKASFQCSVGVIFLVQLVLVAKNYPWLKSVITAAK